MNKTDLQAFLDSRPSLSKEGLAREVGITSQYINMILRGDRRLTEGTINKLKPVLKRYGYSEP